MDSDPSAHEEAIGERIQRLDAKLDSTAAELASRLTIMDGKHHQFSTSLDEAKEHARVTNSQIGAVEHDIEVARIEFTANDALLRQRLDNTGTQLTGELKHTEKQLTQKLDHTEKQLSKDIRHIHIWGSVALIVGVPLLGGAFRLIYSTTIAQSKLESLQPEIFKRLNSLEETIKRLTSFDTVEALKLLNPAKSRIELETALPKLTRLLDDARVQGKAPDNPQALKDAGKTLNSLSQQYSKSPSVWKAVSAYSNYRSKTEANPKITSSSRLPVCSSGAAPDKEGVVLLENCTISLDSPQAKDIRTARGLLFRNVAVEYKGGIILLPDAVFESSLFNLDVTIEPPARGRRLCGVLLTAEDLSLVPSLRTPSENTPSTQTLCQGSGEPEEVGDGHVLFEAKESPDQLVIAVDGHQLNVAAYTIRPQRSKRHVPSHCTGYVLQLKNPVQNGSRLSISSGTNSISLKLRVQPSNVP